jgi:hypothetical protein
MNEEGRTTIVVTVANKKSIFEPQNDGQAPMDSLIFGTCAAIDGHRRL